jgi:hypothetical protein
MNINQEGNSFSQLESDSNTGIVSILGTGVLFIGVSGLLIFRRLKSSRTENFGALLESHDINTVGNPLYESHLSADNPLYESRSGGDNLSSRMIDY